MIFKTVVEFFQNGFSNIGAAPAFLKVVFGFSALSAAGVIILFIKKIKSFAFLGG